MDAIDTRGKRVKSRAAREQPMTRTSTLKRARIKIAEATAEVSISPNKPKAPFTTTGAVYKFYQQIYRMDPIERISVIQIGVEADSLVKVAHSMQRSKESVAKMLGLGISTIERKVQSNQRLTADQSERLVATAKLIGQVQAMVEESGNPEGFDAAKWFAVWLDKPMPALGGHRPAEVMSTAEGRELVSRLLSTAQSGAYA